MATMLHSSDHSTGKNELTIRLTESAVFLRTDGFAARRRNPTSNDARPSMLRGLLTLQLHKPTKITSIEIDLQAKTTTSWPEGVGARRIEVAEEHRVFHASTVYFRAGKGLSRRTASIGPGVQGYDERVYEEEEDQESSSQANTPRIHETISATRPIQNNSFVNDASSSYTAPRGRSERIARRVSVDSYDLFQSSPVSHREVFDMAPIPPYSPFASTPQVGTPTRPNLSPAQSSIGHAPAVGSSESTNPAHSLEEFRNSLHSSLQSQLQSHSSFDRSLSRRPSMDDVPENGPGPSTPRLRSPTPPTSAERRPRSRFSFTAVSKALKGKLRERSIDEESANRGRTLERGRESAPAVTTGSRNSPSTVRTRESTERRSALAKVGEILKLNLEDKREEGDGWKVFKKGTYTYPISFSIPGNSPPTMQCDYGNVVWRLRANVHRPGAFKHKLTASREVIMIACPTEEDTEDTENIIVERHWEQQLQYLISISGRSFYIGGTVPITMTMMPLAKVKVHRISVSIEERVDYYTHMRRIARTDPISRIELLSLKGTGKPTSPILPLDSDDVEAFHNSPWHAIVTPNDDISEMASSLMGPGPWTFHQELKLPHSCAILRFTNKNRRSNIIITHTLKCVIRVERGDDECIDSKTGKRKLFDIVVQTPVHILSCRCNPEWMSLPRYSEILGVEDQGLMVPGCPCEARRLARNAEQHGFRSHFPGKLERMTSRHSSDSVASAAETSPVNPVLMRSLRQYQNLVSSSSQFERLISGQESEMGEAPPSYSTSTDGTSQSISAVA